MNTKGWVLIFSTKCKQQFNVIVFTDTLKTPSLVTYEKHWIHPAVGNSRALKLPKSLQFTRQILKNLIKLKLVRPGFCFLNIHSSKTLT